MWLNIRMWPVMAYVFPAVEVAQVADLGLDNIDQRVARALAKYKLLNVRRLDLASVVDDIAIGVDDDLGNVKTVAFNLRVAHRDVDLSLAGSGSDAAHLIGIWTQTVLVILLEKG